MRIKLLYVILICTFYLSCDEDDYPYAEVPSVVRNSFWAEFPDAANADFRSSGGNYEVEFEIDGKDSEAIIASTGIVLSEKKEISWNQLPAAVRSSLDHEFGQKRIEDPKIIRSGEKVYYQVQVKRLLSDKKLVLDSMGKKKFFSSFWK